MQSHSPGRGSLAISGFPFFWLVSLAFLAFLASKSMNSRAFFAFFGAEIHGVSKLVRIPGRTGDLGVPEGYPSGIVKVDQNLRYDQ